MKSLFFLATSMFACSLLSAQNVGIGTNTPDNNAILDLVSINRGFLLPRIADTPAITTPAAGMLIYNQSTKTPSYHDGSKWNQVNDPAINFVPLSGSITYAVTGTTVGGIAYETGIVAGIDFSNYSWFPYSAGGGGGGIGTIQDADSVTLFKEFDGNSMPFKRAHLGFITIPAIEISQYLPNGTRFYSIKLTNILITSQFNFISEKTGRLTERYGLNTNIIGYKDWINNKSFSYNTSSRTFGVY